MRLSSAASSSAPARDSPADFAKAAALKALMAASTAGWPSRRPRATTTPSSAWGHDALSFQPGDCTPGEGIEQLAEAARVRQGTGAWRAPSSVKLRRQQAGDVSHGQPPPVPAPGAGGPPRRRRNRMRIDAAGAVDAAKTRAKSCCQRGPLPFTEVTTWMFCSFRRPVSSTSRSPEPTQPARARPSAGAPAGNSEGVSSQRFPAHPPDTRRAGDRGKDRRPAGAAPPGEAVQRQQAAVQLAQAATPGETGALPPAASTARAPSCITARTTRPARCSTQVSSRTLAIASSASSLRVLLASAASRGCAKLRQPWRTARGRRRASSRAPPTP